MEIREITGKILIDKKVIKHYYMCEESTIGNMFVIGKIYPSYNLLAVPYGRFCGLCLSKNSKSSVYMGTWKL